MRAAVNKRYKNNLMKITDLPKQCYKNIALYLPLKERVKLNLLNQAGLSKLALRTHSYHKNETMRCNNFQQQKLYFQMPVSLELKEMIIISESKDQGWASVAISSSWVEMEWVDENGVALPMQRLILFQNYKNSTFVRRVNLVSEIPQKARKAKLLLKARYPGWQCYMRSLQVISIWHE